MGNGNRIPARSLCLCRRECRGAVNVRRRLWAFLPLTLGILAVTGFGIGDRAVAEIHVPYLVKDINPTVSVPYTPENADQSALVGSTLFFTATCGNLGRELWKTDGTATGTVFLRDCQPGLLGGFDFPGSDDTPFPPYPHFLSDGIRLWFTAIEDSTGIEPWVSDGTAGGTHVLKEMYPGFNELSFVLEMVTFKGQTFFIALDPVEGFALFRSDGTATGTVLIKGFYPFDPALDVVELSQLTPAGDTLFFYADDGDHGWGLWKSDGTVEGTEFVKRVSDAQPHQGGLIGYGWLTAVGNGSVLFFAWNSTLGYWGLWRSDGTEEGTVFVKTVSPTDCASRSSSWFLPPTLSNNGILYFPSGFYDAGYALWRSDGTTTGTYPLRDFAAGLGESYPTPVAVLGDTVFITVNDGTRGRELWKTDGTTTGTVIVRDIRPGSSSAFPTPSLSEASLARFVEYNGFLYFPADDGIHGAELWRTDGTLANTQLVKDINTGGSSLSFGYRRLLATVNDTLVFSAYQPSSGYRVWKTSGTPESTILLIEPEAASAGSACANLADFDGTLFFGANDGVHGQELWRSDGTATGTLLFKDIYPGSHTSSSGARPLAAAHGTIYFIAHDARPEALWACEHTPESVRFLKDTDSAYTLSTIEDPVVAGNRFFFTADDQIIGQELWTSDGTPAGTLTLKDIGSDSHGWGAPARPTPFGNVVLFDGYTDPLGSSLWRSDGTAAGTTLLKDLDPEPYSPGVSEIVVLNGKAFILASREDRLWVSDGTSAGTLPIEDAGFPAPTAPPPETGRHLFLPAQHSIVLAWKPADGNQLVFLWKTNGTPEGTAALVGQECVSMPLYNHNVEPDKVRSAALPNQHVFMNDDGVHGLEPWVTDGTTAGSFLLRDINPGPTGSQPYGFVVRGNTAYFAASDGESGIEIWMTDGTMEGTQRVADIAPGPYGSMPEAHVANPLVISGDRLYFRADDNLGHGPELWAMDLPPIPPPALWMVE